MSFRSIVFFVYHCDFYGCSPFSLVRYCHWICCVRLFKSSFFRFHLVRYKTSEPSNDEHVLRVSIQTTRIPPSRKPFDSFVCVLLHRSLLLKKTLKRRHWRCCGDAQQPKKKMGNELNGMIFYADFITEITLWQQQSYSISFSAHQLNGMNYA